MESIMCFNWRWVGNKHCVALLKNRWQWTSLTFQIALLMEGWKKECSRAERIYLYVNHKFLFWVMSVFRVTEKKIYPLLGRSGTLNKIVFQNKKKSHLYTCVWKCWLSVTDKMQECSIREWCPRYVRPEYLFTPFRLIKMSK